MCTHQVSLALCYLHDKGIYHRDLKSPNIFLDVVDYCPNSNYNDSNGNVNNDNDNGNNINNINTSSSISSSGSLSNLFAYKGRKYKVRVGDFGLATAVNKTDEVVGSVLWMAPEVILASSSSSGAKSSKSNKRIKKKKKRKILITSKSNGTIKTAGNNISICICKICIFVASFQRRYRY